MKWRRRYLTRSPCLSGYVQPPNGLTFSLADVFRLKHHRKLLDSLPRRYCPNPKCSVLVQIDEDYADPKAQCPACFQWVCVPCKAMWHKGKPHQMTPSHSVSDVQDLRHDLREIPIPALGGAVPGRPTCHRVGQGILYSRHLEERG